MSRKIANKNKKKTKDSFFWKKIKISINNQKQYEIFKSKEFIGLLILILSSFLLVVSFIQVPGFNTIPGYTFGLLFGYCSYFIYLGFIILGLSMLFQIDIRIDKLIAKKFSKKFHFSWITYLFFSIGIALIVESSIQIARNTTVFPGSGAFKNFFSDWWKSFTQYNSTSNTYGNPALPNTWNSGIIVCLFMSLLVSWSSYIVSIIIGVLFISYFVFYTYKGSIIKLIKTKMFGNLNRKEIVNKKEFEDYKTKILDLSFEDSNSSSDNNFLVNNQNNSLEIKTTTISFDNTKSIFSNEDIVINDNDELEKQMLEEKTTQLNLKNNLTSEFNFDSIENKYKEAPEIEGFDFELDIFQTAPNTVEIDELYSDEKNQKDKDKEKQ